jgi:hypothetical protein
LLPDALKAALTRTAAETGQSQAELIREGVRLVTARHRSPKPTIPLFASADPGIAHNLDEAMSGFGEQ